MRLANLLLIGAVLNLPITTVRSEEPKLDVRKYILERPVKELVVTASEIASLATDGQIATKPASDQAVEPGLVRWHSDFDAACRAARASGKPVLLFQLLGQLDQRFT